MMIHVMWFCSELKGPPAVPRLHLVPIYVSETEACVAAAGLECCHQACSGPKRAVRAWRSEIRLSRGLDTSSFQPKFLGCPAFLAFVCTEQAAASARLDVIGSLCGLQQVSVIDQHT